MLHALLGWRPAHTGCGRAEAEMARTQKNKATEHHLGSLKAKLAKLRTEVRAMRPSGRGNGARRGPTQPGDAAPRRSC